MFNNPGKQIQRLAKLLFWLSFLVFIAAGLIARQMIAKGNLDASYISFILIVSVGFLISWLSNLFMCAFGALVENSEIIAKNTDAAIEKLSFIEHHLVQIDAELDYLKESLNNEPKTNEPCS